MLRRSALTLRSPAADTRLYWLSNCSPWNASLPPAIRLALAESSITLAWKVSSTSYRAKQCLPLQLSVAVMVMRPACSSRPDSKRSLRLVSRLTERRMSPWLSRVEEMFSSTALRAPASLAAMSSAPRLYRSVWRLMKLSTRRAMSPPLKISPRSLSRFGVSRRSRSALPRVPKLSMAPALIVRSPAEVIRPLLASFPPIRMVVLPPPVMRPSPGSSSRPASRFRPPRLLMRPVPP
ncbi:hypothetical protein D9M68_532020 [compost metagenome]